jgi:hypothetical protein
MEPARFGLSTLTLPAKVGSELNRNLYAPSSSGSRRSPPDPDRAGRPRRENGSEHHVKFKTRPRHKFPQILRSRKGWLRFRIFSPRLTV